MEGAANEPRPHPRHGWLAAVIPAGAQRFRVGNRELAATLSVAGAQLVETSPDVEIGTPAELEGDADCAVIEVAIAPWRGRRRFVRGLSRLIGSGEILRRTAYARSALRAFGYSSTAVVTWERGVTLGHERYGSVRRQLAHRFPLNAVVVGRRAGSRQSEFDAALSAAEEQLERPLRPEGLLLGASGVVIAMGDDFVLRVAIGPAAWRIAEQRVALETLRDEDPGPLIADRVPWVLAHGKTGLTIWSLERRLPGSMPRPRLVTPLVRDSLAFLQELHLLAKNEGDPTANVERADAVAQLCGEPTGSALRDFGAHLDRELRGIPRGFAHGDFWTGNLLMGSDGLAGVVDWPGAAAGSLPLLDLLHLEVNSVRELTGRQLGSVLIEDALPGMRAGGSEIVRSYCRRLGLDFDAAQSEALVGAYWLQAVAHELFDPDRDPNQAADPEWRSQNIELVLETLTRGRPVTTRPRGAGQSIGSAEVVTDAAALDAALDEWRDLAVARSNPFVTPEWFFSWLKLNGERCKPFVPLVRRADGRLLGLFPLVIADDGRYPALRFAGADLGDRFEPVVSDDDEEVLGTAAAGCLKQNDDDWGILVADYAPEGAEWLQALSDSPGLVAIRYHARPSIYRSIGLAGHTWETLLSSMSRNLRGQIGRKLRALEREHEVRFRQTLDPADVPSDMARLFALHHERWRTRGGTFLDDERARAFHADFAAASLERGWLRLWSLDVDGEAIAVWYGWHIGGRYLYYQAGFDPAWSRHSPGLLLLAHTIRSAVEEGATEYDMLLGDEPYKSRFATRARAGRTVVVTRTLHPSRAIVTVDVGLRRMIRALPPDLHTRIRRAATPFMKRWPVKTAP
jgi:CelD/BcsL family acetyltransferase involved in cellulose biosynthesis